MDMNIFSEKKQKTNKEPLIVCVCKLEFSHHYLFIFLNNNTLEISFPAMMSWPEPRSYLRKKLYLWLFNKTHYQIDEIRRITIITFTMMKQVYKKKKIRSEQICTGTVHWCEPLTTAPREPEEHSLYTSREYTNFIFYPFLSFDFFFLHFVFFF